MENYYELLEISQKASKETIEKVYKMFIKKYHPDLYKDDEKIIMNNKIQEYNHAYEVLIDDNLRKEYDEKLKNSRNDIIKEKKESNPIVKDSNIFEHLDKILWCYTSFPEEFISIKNDIENESELTLEDKTSALINMCDTITDSYNKDNNPNDDIQKTATYHNKYNNVIVSFIIRLIIIIIAIALLLLLSKALITALKFI